MARAVRSRITPATLRTTAACVRTNCMCPARRCPRRAKTSSGTATPMANATVRTRADRPNRCSAPTTVIAASTGPAQGTNTRPRLSPSTNPPPSVCWWPRPSRPIAVVGGLVLSFSVFTLTGSWLLSILGLPLDALRWIGLLVLGALGLGLIVPALGEALEVPFARLGRGHQHTEGGGFVLGLSLGLVFVPCAGPVLAAITVVGAEHRFGLSALVLTVAFAMGVAVPLLVFALLGQRLAGHMQLVRTHAAVVRRVAGVILLLTALAIGFNLTAGLQGALPGYTDALQKGIEANAGARQALGGVTGNGSGGVLANCTDGSPVLQQCGTAPPISGITQWLNTPDGRSLSIAGLRGRVVLVDFWTYSCIN